MREHKLSITVYVQSWWCHKQKEVYSFMADQPVNALKMTAYLEFIFNVPPLLTRIQDWPSFDLFSIKYEIYL